MAERMQGLAREIVRLQGESDRTILVPDQACRALHQPHERCFAFLENGDADGYRSRLDEFH
jgi:hypothetical protein